MPTPVIGCVGIIENISESVSVGFKAHEEIIIVIGETVGWLGCSLYQRQFTDKSVGAPPPVNLNDERKNGDLIRKLIADNYFTSCHDVSDGGIAIAIAEMAIEGEIAAKIDFKPTIPLHSWAFGEDQGRYIVTTKMPDKVQLQASKVGVKSVAIGVTCSTTLTLPGTRPISIEELRNCHRSWFPEYMSG